MWYLLFLVIGGVNADCVYKLRTLDNLTMVEDPYDESSNPPVEMFSVVAADTSRWTTVADCVTYCTGQSWCYAVGDSATGKCQFYTDLGAMGLAHHNCDFKINYECVVHGNDLINMGGEVWTVGDLNNFGGGIHDVVLPQFVTGRTGSGVCTVTTSSPNVVTNATHNDVYSLFYSGTYGYPNAWFFMFHEDIVGVGSPALYATPDVSVPVGDGFPIKGIQYWSVDPTQTNDYEFAAGARTTVLRNKHVQAHQCSTGLTGTYVDKFATRDTNHFFYIVAGDNNNTRYLNCDIANACKWGSFPDTKWALSSFSTTESDIQGDVIGRPNLSSFIAFDMDGVEEGWLVADDGGGIKLVANGGVDPTTGRTARAGAWDFTIDPNGRYEEFDREPGPVMVGDGFCYTQYRYVTDTSGTQISGHRVACLAEQLDSDVARTCDINKINLGGPEFNISVIRQELAEGANVASYYTNECNDRFKFKNANKIKMVPLQDTVGGTHLFKVFSKNKSKRLHCPVGPFECKWVAPNDTAQLFKFDGNGVVEPHGIDFKKPASSPQTNFVSNVRQRMRVYDKVGGQHYFYSYVGDAAVGSGLFLRSSRVTNVDLGVVKRERAICLTDQEYSATFCLDDTGDSVEMKLRKGEPDVPPSVVTDGYLVFEPVVDTLTVSDEQYKWVTGGECPTGYYMHQIRCLDGRQCTTVEVGCKLDSPNCKLDGTVQGTTINLTHSLFADCPPSHVVTAISPNQSITCSKLVIKGTSPTDHSFPPIPSIGFVVRNRDNFDTQFGRQKVGWVGPTPIQRILVDGNTVRAWEYGQTCHAENADSKAFTNGTLPDHSITTTQPATDTPFMCKGDDSFVSFIRCVEADCTKGIEFFCDAVNKCRWDSHDTVEVTGLDPVCPFGTAIVGMSCVGTPGNPCDNVKLACRKLDYDPGHRHRPDKPTGGSDGDGGPTIVIVLATSLPLVIVSAILCLFCIPDVDDTAINRVRDQQQREASQTGASTGVRRRRRQNIF